ncbi:MAG: hypothetical protein R6U50_09755 [Desulfobacterales bacterium]
MMKTAFRAFAALLALTFPVFPVSGAFLYKSYVVEQDRGRDILCDPYIVRKNDWVIKLFQQRGQISEQDFPEFLRIFKRLNPNVDNVDKILPGQNILIPLKIIDKDSLPGQASGIVTIPFVTISKAPEIVKENAKNHTVAAGECVSGILSSQFGRYGSKSYEEGLKLFKLLNPEITNVDRIYSGQVIQIPDAAIKQKPWYALLFTETGEINRDLDLGSLMAADKASTDQTTGTDIIRSPIPAPLELRPKSSYTEAANALDAELLARGTYFFPRKGKRDLKLDMGRFPVIEFTTGQKYILNTGGHFSTADKAVMQHHWPGLKIIPVPFQASFVDILDALFTSDQRFNAKNRLVLERNGIEIDIIAKWVIESGPSDTAGELPKTNCIFIAGPEDRLIPETIKQYLAEMNIRVKEIGRDGTPVQNAELFSKAGPEDRCYSEVYTTPKNLLDRLASLAGYHYLENIEVSFPYAGDYITAYVNLIVTPSGKQLLVDYGDLYGDAVSSIKRSGLDILQLSFDEPWEAVIAKISDALNLTVVERPSFKAAERNDTMNIHLHVPGFSIDLPDGKQYLITKHPLHPELKKFLSRTHGSPALIRNANRADVNPVQEPDAF